MFQYLSLEVFLNRDDVFKQVVFEEEAFAGQYRTFRDEEHFKTNRLLANQKSISLGVYINSFEKQQSVGNF